MQPPSDIIVIETKNCFLNPLSDIQRDVGVLSIQTYDSMFPSGSRLKKIVEGFAASGIRAIRYALELQNVDQVIACELDAKSVETLTENVRKYADKLRERNVSVVVEHCEINSYLQGHADCFHVIDLDPFGSVASYLKTAAEAVVNNGLLCISTFDMLDLSGMRGPSVAATKYEGIVTLPRGRYFKEVAIRALLWSLNVTCKKSGRKIQPLLSLNLLDYIARVFVTVVDNSEDDEDDGKALWVWQCSSCPCYEYQREEQEIKEKCCDACHRVSKLHGPIWAGPIHNHEFVKAVKDLAIERNVDSKLIRILDLASMELHQEAPLFYECFDFSISDPMEIISLLQSHGFLASPTHCTESGFKTTCPFKQIRQLVLSRNKTQSSTDISTASAHWKTKNKRTAPANSSSDQSVSKKPCVPAHDQDLSVSCISSSEFVACPENFLDILQTALKSGQFCRVVLSAGTYSQCIALNRAICLQGQVGAVLVSPPSLMDKNVVHCQGNDVSIVGLKIVHRSFQGQKKHSHPFAILKGERILVKDCEITRENDSESKGDACVFVSGAAEVRLVNNQIHHGCGVGMVAAAKARITMVQNEITEVKSAGIQVKGSAHVSMLQDRISLCGKAGLFIQGNAQVEAKSVHISQNTYAGIEVQSSQRVVLDDCVISQGKGGGVFVLDSGKVVLNGCKITENSLSNLHVSNRASMEAVACVVSQGLSSGVFVERNSHFVGRELTMCDNQGYGIEVTTNSTAELNQCTITNNARGTTMTSKGGQLIDKKNNMSDSLASNYAKWDKFQADSSDDDSDEEDNNEFFAKFRQPAPPAATTTTTNEASATLPSPPTTNPSSSSSSDFNHLSRLVKESCASVAAQSAHVKIDEEALDRYAATLNAETVRNGGIGEKLVLPFRFSEDELITFVSLLKFMDFGSGWSNEIEKATGKHPMKESTTHAMEPVLYGLIGVAMGGSSLTSEKLAAISQFEFARHFQMSLTKEVAIHGPLKKDVDSDVRPLVDKYYEVVQQTCRILRERNFEYLGQFMLSLASNGLADAGARRQKSTVDEMLSRIASTFPVMRDECVYKGQRVAFYSRAMSLLYGLHVTIPGEHCQLSDPQELSGYSGCIAPAFLHNLGILKYDEALTAKVENGEEIVSGSEMEIELRACSVVAMQKIAERMVAAEQTVHSYEIGSYFQSLGRSGFDSLHPHICKSTTNY